jgi:hypothetical protein
MSAYTRIFAPRAGWFGAQLVNTAIEIGTGAVTIADTTTTSVVVPIPGVLTSFPKAEGIIVGINYSVMVVAASAGQTVTVRAFKRNNQSTPADKALTAAKSILADIVTVLDTTYSLPITAVDPDVIFQTGDALRFDFAASGSVSTQPTMTLSCCWAVRRI